VPCDVLVDCLADVIRQRDVAELPFLAELQRLQLCCRVALFLDPQSLAPVDPAAQVDREGLADPQPAAVHQPHGGGPVRRQPGGRDLEHRLIRTSPGAGCATVKNGRVRQKTMSPGSPVSSTTRRGTPSTVS
jgi:hypothetical protein